MFARAWSVSVKAPMIRLLAATELIFPGLILLTTDVEMLPVLVESEPLVFTPEYSATVIDRYARPLNVSVTRFDPPLIFSAYHNCMPDEGESAVPQPALLLTYAVSEKEVNNASRKTRPTTTKIRFIVRSLNTQ